VNSPGAFAAEKDRAVAGQTPAPRMTLPAAAARGAGVGDVRAAGGGGGGGRDVDEEKRWRRWGGVRVCDGDFGIVGGGQRMRGGDLEFGSRCP
jgi:hypothetical protein